MSWTAENFFVLSLILQDGVVGLTFPYYFQSNQTLGVPPHINQIKTRNSLGVGGIETPDEDVFRYIAGNIIGRSKKYSNRNISCYYRAKNGVENGYRLLNRYR